MTIEAMKKEGYGARKIQITVGKELTEMYKSGKSCSEIAEALGISEAVVRVVVSRFEKEN